MNDRPPGYVSHEQAVAELIRALNERMKTGRSRLDAMVAELEAQLDRAQRHAGAMRAVLPESAGWSRPEDRAWLVDATDEAEQMVRDAAARLEMGRRIVRCHGKETIAT